LHTWVLAPGRLVDPASAAVARIPGVGSLKDRAIVVVGG
jgi:hypothetical protein